MKKKIKVEIKAEPPKGMLEKLGIKDSEDLAAQIDKDFAESEQLKYGWIPERNEDVKNYFGVTKSAEWPFKGASRIKSQFQRIVIDTLSGNLIKSIFLPEHPIRPVPAPLNKESSDETLQNIKYVEDLHNSLQANEYNLRGVLDKAIPTSLIESFVVLHPVYEYLVNEVIVSVTRMVPKDVDTKTLSYDLTTDSVMTAEGEFVPSIDMSRGYEEDQLNMDALQEVTFDVYKEECIKDGISIKVLNGYKFYFPISTPGETPYEKVQRGASVIHDLDYTVREFENYRDTGYFEDVDPRLDNVYDPQKELITYTKFMQAGFIHQTAEAQSPFIRCLKWCGKWKINGKWRELIVWKDKNSLAILRVEPNIFGVRPYFPIVPFPIDDTPYGESLCKIIRPLVKEIDLLMRTITNIALMKSAPPKFYDPASGFNPSTIGQFGPNSWIPAREPSRNVFVPNSPEDPNIGFQMLSFLVNIVERITGVSEVIQGQVSQRANTTATEVQNSLIRAGVRFDTVYERIKDQLKPMFPYIHKLSLRYMPTVKEVRLMGAGSENRLAKIHKGQLQGEFAFELSGNSVVSEQNELQNALALSNTLLGNETAKAYVSYKPESIYYILFNIIKRLNPIAMDKILPTPQEVAELERSRQSVTQEQEQMAQEQQQGDAQAQAQVEQQQAQMQAAITQQQMQQDGEKHQLDMQIKQDEFHQKMKHNEETHKQKLEQMKEVSNAKAKEAAKAKPKD